METFCGVFDRLCNIFVFAKVCDEELIGVPCTNVFGCDPPFLEVLVRVREGHGCVRGREQAGVVGVLVFQEGAYGGQEGPRADGVGVDDSLFSDEFDFERAGTWMGHVFSQKRGNTKVAVAFLVRPTSSAKVAFEQHGARGGTEEPFGVLGVFFAQIVSHGRSQALDDTSYGFEFCELCFLTRLLVFLGVHVLPTSLGIYAGGDELSFGIELDIGVRGGDVNAFEALDDVGVAEDSICLCIDEFVAATNKCVHRF